MTIRSIEETLQKCEQEAREKVGGIPTGIDIVDNLRALAYFLKDKPTLVERIGTEYFTVYNYDWQGGKEELAKLVEELGACEKRYSGDSLYLERKFGKSFMLKVCTGRDVVCKRVRTGTKHVEAYYSEAHEEPIYEWECDESLLDKLGGDNV